MLNIDTTLFDQAGRPLTGAPTTTGPVQTQAQPAQPPAPVADTWWSRARANFQDAWRTGTLAGAATTAVQTGLGTDQTDVVEERQRREQFEQMPSWLDAPDAATKLKNFSAMVAGQVAGSMASPESLISAPLKGLQWAARGATALSRAGRRAAVQGGTQAAVNLATDPLVQGSNIASGVQDEYNVAQTALSPVLGAAVGGTLGGLNISGTPRDIQTFNRLAETRETVIGRRLTEAEREALQVAQKFLDTGDLDKYAANINLERIAAGEDVKTLIAETAQTHATTIEAIRRGAISNEQLQAMANDLNMTPEKFIEMTQRPGTIVNAENMLAGRQLMVDSSVETVAAANLYKANPTPENLAKFLQSADLSTRLVKAVSGPTAESGRLQQQFNIIVPGEDRARALRFALEKNPELRQDAEAMSAMVSSLEDPAAVREMLRRIRAAERGKPITTIEKFVEAWKAGLLTGLRTTTTNLTSNFLTNLMAIPTDIAASGIGKARNLVFGGEDAASMTGAFSRIYSLFWSSNDQLGAWGNFMESMRTAETPEVFGRRTEFEMENAIGGKLGEVVRIPFRFLTAQDAFFKSLAGRQELTALGWDALQKLPNYRDMSLQDRVAWVNNFVRTPPKDAMEQAVAQADYMTFNKELGKLGRSFQAVLERYPAAQFIVPFLRTPVNIVKYGFEHTPLVAFNPSYRNLRGKELDRAIAKASMGSAFMLSMYGMAQEGIITGAGPQDPAELATLKATGWQPYSIKIGDKYYSYERAQPIAMLMGIAADMQYLTDQIPQTASARDIMDAKGALNAQDLYVNYGIHIFMENIVNSTFTLQINNLVESLNDPSGNKWENLVNSLAGSAVPNIVGDVARAMDPVVRRPDGPAEAIQARIPGMSQEVTPARDWTGRERTRDYGPVAQMISPSLPSTQTEDKAIREVARIGYRMPMVPKTYGNVELSGEQRDLFAKVAGQFRYNNISRVVNSPGYQAMASSTGGDEKVRRAFAVAIENANKLAEAELIRAYPELARAKADETTRAFGRQPVPELPALRRQ